MVLIEFGTAANSKNRQSLNVMKQPKDSSYVSAVWMEVTQYKIVNQLERVELTAALRNTTDCCTASQRKPRRSQKMTKQMSKLRQTS